MAMCPTANSHSLDKGEYRDIVNGLCLEISTVDLGRGNNFPIEMAIHNLLATNMCIELQFQWYFIS